MFILSKIKRVAAACLAVLITIGAFGLTENEKRLQQMRLRHHLFMKSSFKSLKRIKENCRTKLIKLMITLTVNEKSLTMLLNSLKLYLKRLKLQKNIHWKLKRISVRLTSKCARRNMIFQIRKII